MKVKTSITVSKNLLKEIDSIISKSGNRSLFIDVSRQALIDSKFSTVICAPIYSHYHGISTQVPVVIDDGLKHESCIYCDEIISIPKSVLTDYIGILSLEKLDELNKSL